jgi:hypothetical protein
MEGGGSETQYLRAEQVSNGTVGYSDLEKGIKGGW